MRFAFRLHRYCVVMKNARSVSLCLSSIALFQSLLSSPFSVRPYKYTNQGVIACSFIRLTDIGNQTEKNGDWPGTSYVQNMRDKNHLSNVHVETCTELDEKWSTRELRRDEATKQLSDRSVLRCAPSLLLTPREVPSSWLRYIIYCVVCTIIITLDASHKGIVYAVESDYERVHARQNTLAASI